MADMKRMVGKSKPASKKISNGSDTKPYNVKLMTPKELVGGKKEKPAPKKPVAPRTPAKGVKATMPKTAPSGKKKNMPLTGPAAIEAIQRRTSPAGVKKAETGAKNAIDKKYPGLYKKSK